MFRWINPEESMYLLALRTVDSLAWNVYNGGHNPESAPVDLSKFDLSGTEILFGKFSKYDLNSTLLEQFSGFTIDLSAIEFPKGSDSETSSDDTDVASSESTTATIVGPGPHPIEDSGIGAYFELYYGEIIVKWDNPEHGSYTLSLRTADSFEWNIFNGGHESGRAQVVLSKFNLSGSGILKGEFAEHDMDGVELARYRVFSIDLSAIEFPEESIVVKAADETDTDSGDDPIATPVPTPTVVNGVLRYPVIGSGMGAHYVVVPGAIEIRWTDAEDGTYSLALKTEGSSDWDIVFGGHQPERVDVVFAKFGLSGTETLTGDFIKDIAESDESVQYPTFSIDLSAIQNAGDAEDEGASGDSPSATPTPTAISTSTSTTMSIPGQHPIEGAGMGAYYVVRHGGIDIKWDNFGDSRFKLYLRTRDSPDWNIYRGGHESGLAPVALRVLSLLGTETLVGNFTESSLEGSPLREYPTFAIDLSTVEFPSESVASVTCLTSNLAQPGDVATTTPAPNVSALPPPPVSPARHDVIDLLTGDFTDSDGDGMTDAAEAKYGFDPQDPSSFPAEPAVIRAVRHSIDCFDMGAHYTVHLDRINIHWTNPGDGIYSLGLRTADSDEWNLYQGGHFLERAQIDLDTFQLTGTETLVGEFIKYDINSQYVGEYSEFIIPLTTVEFPDRSILGNPSNRLSYTFSSDYPQDAEVRYREFLKRVFPLIHGHMGPPAESFNTRIDYGGDDIAAYVTLDDGRKLIADQNFFPRLIVHELVHAWNGNYAITSDQNWSYDDSLSGFEEGIAEGAAYEIMHEYVRSYPDHFASFHLLDDRAQQYWSRKATSYDAIKHSRWTGAGDFWTHTGGPVNRYSISANTVQIMVQEEPRFLSEFMALYYETIRRDKQWRPNRDDVIGMWETIVPALNGYPLKIYLDAIPVFNGRKLDEGVYVLEEIRSYGEYGDQQIAVSYAIPDGRLWWSLREDDLENVPGWIRTNLGDDGRFYVDTQNSNFTVNVVDAHGSEVSEHKYKTDWERWTDGTADGFGWYYAEELKMQNFPLGLYKETVTFTDYIEFDEGAREEYYFIGVEDFRQDREEEYVIMIGVDGVPEGLAEITVDDVSHTSSIKNGLAVFRSREWPIDLQGNLPITITNSKSESRSYFRTLIEAGTVHDYFQHQFIIVDTDFNGVEDQFE